MERTQFEALSLDASAPEIECCVCGYIYAPYETESPAGERVRVIPVTREDLLRARETERRRRLAGYFVNPDARVSALREGDL